MSQKRKLEEYHDPDYPQNVKEKIAKLSTDVKVEKKDKLERITDIISREFEREIINKEKEVYEISHRINLVRKMLHKVCFAVISNYYNKRNLNIAPEEIAHVQENISRLFTNDLKGPQSAVHPSLKKILGSNEVDYKELLNSRPTRQAAITAQSTIKEKFKTKKEMRIERLRLKAIESIQENITIDESLKHTTIVKENLDDYSQNECNNIAENVLNQQSRWDRVEKLNTDKGVNLSKQIIAVGNTSKFIQKETETDKVTHKWLIYVQSKTLVPIEKFVKKIRFYLHPSYKPNDIVDVDCPPFHLARRGWGEFPVRIQLHFLSKFQQKPVQFFHNLVLDKTLSGLQTMGSETVVELWLRSFMFSPNIMDIQNNDFKYSQYCKNSSENHTNIVIKQEENQYYQIKKENPSSPLEDTKNNLIDFLNQIDQSMPSDLDSIEPTLILSPTTHKNLKISEAINSPIQQNKCDNYIGNFDVSIIKKEYRDEILIPKNNIKKENDHLKDIYNSWNETISSEISHQTLPINIKKINNKLNETIKSEIDIDEHKQSLCNENLDTLHLNEIKSIKNSNQAKSILIKQNSPIILKDGNVSIIDPSQIKLKKKRKQISLLKPVIKTNSNLNASQRKNFYMPWILDHDYTSPWKEVINVEQKPIKNKNNEIEYDLDNRNMINNDDFISVVISDNTKQLINLKKKITLTVKEEPFSKEGPFVDYRGEFELEFHNKKFASENSLVEYCLKNVPLVNIKASDVHYKTAFPFVVNNLYSLKCRSLPKRRALEWLQCKYFSTLMKNHGQFPETVWSTKEIILYARSYGFAPTKLLCEITNIGKSITNNSVDYINEKYNEKHEKCIENIYEWINEFVKNENNDEIVDKINIDDDIMDSKIVKNTCQTTSSAVQYQPNTIVIPIDQKFSEESILINEICNEIDISLKPEPITLDVHMNASELVLISIFRKFLENLIRKSIFEIRNTKDIQSIPVVKNEDIKHAILSNPDFKFLTNRIYKNIKEIKKEIL